MWLMIVQMFGHILSYSKWIMWESLQLLQVVHRMDFLQQDSFGEIRCTDGMCIKIPAGASPHPTGIL